jgi:hypothetical protein
VNINTNLFKTVTLFTEEKYSLQEDYNKNELGGKIRWSDADHLSGLI